MGKRRRSSGTGKYVQLYRWMTNTAAWADLDGNARAIYIEIAMRYAGPGSNNGRIPYSVREAAESLRISKATASRALRSLTDHGFIIERQKGSFSRKVRHATTWRLTEFTCDVTGELPTKAFMRWEPKIQNTVSPENPIGPSHETVTSGRRASLAYRHTSRAGYFATSRHVRACRPSS